MRITFLPYSRSISYKRTFCYTIRTHLHFLNGFPFADDDFEATWRGQTTEENEPPMEASIALAVLRVATSALPTSGAHLVIRSWAARCGTSAMCNWTKHIGFLYLEPMLKLKYKTPAENFRNLQNKSHKLQKDPPKKHLAEQCLCVTCNLKNLGQQYEGFVACLSIAIRML